MFVSSVTLDGALASARRERIRLASRVRKLLRGSFVTAALVLAYLVAAILQPFAEGPLRVGLEVGLALGASAGLLVLAHRTRATLDRTAEDVRLLELARDATERAEPPRVEIHPYRRGGGPTLVVRTDALHDRQRAASAPAPSPIARATAAMLVASVAALVAAFLLGDGPRAKRRWTFDDAHASLEAVGLRASDARSGAWSVEEDDRATGARAVVVRAGDADAPAATLLAAGLRARDVRVVTRCRVVAPSGGDASCGLVLRHDGGDHVVARFEAAAARVVLVVVTAGRERVLGAAPAPIAAAAWQEIAVDARGDLLVVSWNGRRAIEARAPHAPRSGAVGLWAPSRAEAVFDELLVETLPPSVLAS